MPKRGGKGKGRRQGGGRKGVGRREGEAGRRKKRKKERVRRGIKEITTR